MRDYQGYDYELLNMKATPILHCCFTGKPRNGRLYSCYLFIVGLLVSLLILFLLLLMYSHSQGIKYYEVVEEQTHYTSYNATLVRIPPELAIQNGAFCLDGSVPTYYFREGEGDGKRSWMVYLAGGGWCWDLNDCYLRSYTPLGSSKNLSMHLDLIGVHSDNASVNPDFYNWNIAIVNYCDGASFSGNVPYPVAHKNQTLFFRGALVLDLVINYLVQSAGLGDADRIILAGGSAGAKAVVLHIDHIKTLIPAGIPFHGLADAGMFLDAKNMSSFHHFRVCSQNVYNIQRAWGSLNQDCVASEASDSTWRCFFTEYAYKYVQTPIFYINSLYDYWGLWHILEMRCYPTQCPEKMSFFNQFHKEYLDFAKDVRKQSTMNGMFVSSCYAHSQTLDGGTFNEYKIGGKSVQEAFGDWYFGRSSPGESFYFDCEDRYDCNPTCDWSFERYEEKTTYRMNKSTRRCAL